MTLLSPTRKRVLSPALEHVPKRHEVSVGDKKLSSAPAPEQVPELQLFANLAIEEGAPPLSYWEGLYDQLKKVDCELDFPAIEELVFNCLVLGPAAMGKAEAGRLLLVVRGPTPAQPHRHTLLSPPTTTSFLLVTAFVCGRRFCV
jgi:hypothetical protein